MSSDANGPHYQGDEFSSGPPLDPDAWQPTKAEADALKSGDRRAAHMVNLILQRSSMRPGEVVEVILPDNLVEEEDYVEDDEFCIMMARQTWKKCSPTLTTTPSSSTSIPEMPLVGLCVSILVISRCVESKNTYRKG
jgi:hypothetical protein